MNSKGGAQQLHRLDWLKWLVVAAVLVAGIIVNYCYNSVAWSIRAAIGIVVCLALAALVLKTAKGQKAWGFIKGARTELRKVAWPTRQETIQTTVIVVVMVIVTAVVLWGLDSLFLWAIALLTGQRG